ncbi:hypothetical protein Y032_0154g3028 [Ancylostoma ceylanicum]|nr:hypothetical protein Y032_0154g3028 [Ancylostoma ceylanicum]
MERREDIQGLRGWAIVMVVLFHFFPNYFPNGYIGVDVFFVISGFLIAMILQRNNRLDTTSILTFYYRRIRRILTLYYVAMIGILLSLIFLLPSTYHAVNVESSRKALLLITNTREDDEEQNYERKVPSRTSEKELTMEGGKTTIEPTRASIISPENLNHGWLVASTVVFLSLLAMFSFFWLPWPKTILRIAVTTLSAALIFIGSQYQTIILTNHVYKYIGDISYALYLIHWPIFVIINSYSCHASFARIAGIAISVNLAIVVHHIFESHYQRWPPFVILPLLMVLGIVSSVLYFAIYKQATGAEKVFLGSSNYNGINPSDAAWNMTLMRHLISTGFDAQSNANMTFCKKEIRTSTDLQARVYCITV